MPLAIAEFRLRHPAVELSLEPREPLDAIDCVKSGECDVALSLEPSFRPLEDEAIRKTTLVDDPMFLVLPANHPLAHKPGLRLEDVADQSFILGSTTTCPDTTILLRAANAAGVEPRIAFQSDDYTAIQGFIAAGVGVGLIPDLALVSVRDDIVIRDLGPQAPSRQVFAASLAAGYCSPATAAMLEILADVGAEYERGRRRLALAS
jgi:DNA-binding transcriptional LysR family regulator